jgi:hypothetical protein
VGDDLVVEHPVVDGPIARGGKCDRRVGAAPCCKEQREKAAEPIPGDTPP